MVKVKVTTLGDSLAFLEEEARRLGIKRRSTHMARYRYTVEGTAAQDPGQTWKVEGEREGTIPTLMDVVLLEAFQKLTRGEARYRNLQTCRGPYTITRLEIVEVGK